MEKLICKDDCYVQSSCKAYKNDRCYNDFCIRLFKINDLYDKSLLTMEQRKEIGLVPDNSSDSDSFVKLFNYKNNILDFVSNGKNLYICSSITGNGKTSWAIKFIQSYVKNIWASSDLVCRCLFISVPKYLRELKLNIDKKSEYISYINDSVLDADLVVWDDIATKSSSEYELEQLMSIIDSRINNKKSNIFTSNVLPDYIGIILGNRLSSRIKNLSECIQFTGNDKRGDN